MRRWKVGPTKRSELQTTFRLEHVPDTLIGKRDRAILLIGFAAALRRSEIAALHVSDLEMHADGLLLHIGKSKTDRKAKERRSRFRGARA
jgi:integrase